MCKELENQMAESLRGTKSTPITRAINILAMFNDRKFVEVDKKLELQNEVLKKQDVKLDKILEVLTSSKKEIEIKFGEQEKKCNEHKKELTKKFSEIDTSTETLNYFNKHPILLKIIGVAILILIAYAIGHSEIIDKIIR